VRYYFEWMMDHRFTDFLVAKRDLFLFPPDEKALEKFRAAIRGLIQRTATDAEIVKADAQRAFFLRRFGQELEPLLALALSSDLPAQVDAVQAHLVEIQDRVRAYSL
jgi:hypothetical protein